MIIFGDEWRSREIFFWQAATIKRQSKEKKLASKSMAAGSLYLSAILNAEATVDQSNTAINP